jgi:Ser/Thr protein kinase RdoA (MazF antagonist)
MSFIDFNSIIKEAWNEYDSSREIAHIVDISAKVSTNHVYRITLKDKNFIVAKLSYFGKFEHFVEDHSIINTLSNNLPSPFENFLARSLMKGNKLFVYRHKSEIIDAWIVFYRPIHIKNKLPKRLDKSQIEKLGVQTAHFHKACSTVKATLPRSSKTMQDDINDLLQILDDKSTKYEYPMHRSLIREHCDLFLENYIKLDADSLDIIPVFVDWNIGNFSVTPNFKLFSRWDYDWFRMSTRMLDFYFFSRVSSDIGDKTVFSYNVNVMMEERFKIFLKSYHKVFPLNEIEIRFLKEAYRFFILTYVIKYGRFFFHEIFANKLQKEALEHHLPALDDTFDPEPLLKSLNI